LQIQHDGQFAHVRHAQIARRATLPQPPAIAEKRKSIHIRPSPSRHEGRYGRSSRNVRRVAMDADGAQDDARGKRSTKPRGPDTPMLVSSINGHAPLDATVTRTPGTPRRARYKSSNIAQGMPACVRLYLS